MDKLEKWYSQFKNQKQLTCKEAKEKIKSAMLIDDDVKRNEALNDVIIQTAYVIYDFIKNSNFDIYKGSSFDMDDIISNLMKEWIICIKNKTLLEFDTFKQMIHQKIYTNTTINIVEDTKEKLPFTKTVFIKYFIEYIKLKNQSIELSFEEFSKITKLHDFKSPLIFECCEILYDRLCKKGEYELNLGITELERCYQLLIEICYTDRIMNGFLSNDDTEKDAIYLELKEKIKKILMELPKRERRIIELRYALKDEGPYTLEELSKMYNLSREGVRKIERKALKNITAKTSSKQLKKYY